MHNVLTLLNKKQCALEAHMHSCTIHKTRLHQHQQQQQPPYTIGIVTLYRFCRIDIAPHMLMNPWLGDVCIHKTWEPWNLS